MCHNQTNPCQLLKANSAEAPPSACPKFHKCNAPICPLDPNWHLRKHLKDEKCCLYLLESCKSGAKAVFEGAGLSDLYKAISSVQPEIADSYAPIKRACDRASISASRMNSNLKGTSYE